MPNDSSESAAPAPDVTGESKPQRPTTVAPVSITTGGGKTIAFVPPRPPRDMRRVWLGRIILGLALLAAIWLGRDFYKQYYYTDGVPTWAQVQHWMQAVPGWNSERIQRVIQGPTFREKLIPRLRVAAFVLVLWIVLLWAAAILCYEYVFHFATRGEQRNRFAPYVWLRRSILTIAGIGSLCLLYGFWVEPYWLQVTHLTIESAKLAHGAKIRVVLISDLHMARRVRLEPRLPSVIEEQKPDLIVFSGDAMNSSWALGRFKQFLLRATQIAPVYLVRGNQDGGSFWDPKDIYGGTNTHELTGQVEKINVRGTELWIRGAADWATYSGLPKDPPPPGQFSIFIFHRPDEILGAARDGYDLYLCGHTHGGQIALPFYGALITYSKFDKRFEAGLYHVGNTTMYVNRGIGLAKWPQPEARFFARPELTVIDLVGR